MIRIYDLHELDDLPKPEWLVENILQRHTVAVLAATRGAYKTFLAIDWGLSIALGRDWQGRKVVQGNVLHLVGEGGAGIWARTKAWRIHNQIELRRPAPWKCTVTGINLIDESSVRDLAQAALIAFPEGVELLVVDTLARNQQGDENSSQTMSQLVRHVDALREVLGCTVLILHHFNKSGTFRGSSVLEGAFDTVILMERSGEVATVSCDKQKDGDEFDPFKLKEKKIDVTGSHDGSLVLEPDNDIEPHIATIVRVVAQNAGRGMTRGEALTRIESMQPKPFGEDVFCVAWKQATDMGVIAPKDGLLLLHGTLWVRNLELLEVA